VVRAVCPGSFDPVTYGHLDVIERSAALFDTVIVAVGSNIAKNALFTPAERVEMLTEVCAAWSTVTVTQFSGLLVDFCRTEGAEVISKGLRSGDVEFEVAMAQMNRQLTGVDTVLLPTGVQWSFVSSSLVREVAGLGGDIDAFLPPPVAELTRRRIQERLSPS